MNFKLLLVMVACIARKFYSHAWECVDSGQKVNGVTIYTPKHCVPTTCKVTTSSGATVDGFNCAIGNTDRYPTACRDFENAVVTAHTEKNESERFLSDVCQATLASIGLYKFSCKEVPLVSESLAFTIDLPTCGRTFSGPQDAVMAEFYCRNKTVDEYYSSIKVCRVFRFGNNDLSRFSPDDSIQVFYDCMGMGLQKEYPKALYYLSLSTYPWQAVLNYTIAYLAKASEGSMRLVAAAWRSTRRIHVAFQPIVGVTAYRVQAKGDHLSFSKIVSTSSPSVEIEDIPPQTRIVTVTVKPEKWKHGGCPPFQMPCSPIEVTLHDSHQLNLPVEPLRPKENDQQFWMIMGVVVGTCGAVVMVVVLIIVITRGKRCFQVSGGKGGDSGKGQKVMTINNTPGDPQACRILEKLQKQGFIVTEVFQNPEQFSSENAPNPGMFQGQGVILLFIHPSAPNQQDWTVIENLIKAIFQMSLVKKTKVVSLTDKNGNRVKPSEIFSHCLIHFDAFEWDKFLDSLDMATFYMPQDWKKLMRHLKDWSKQTKGWGTCARYEVESEISFGEEAGIELLEAGDSDSDHEHRQEDVIEAQVHQPRDGLSGQSLARVRYPGHSNVDARASVETQRQQEEQNMPSDPWDYRHCQVHPNSERSPLLRPTQPSVDGPPVGTPLYHHDPCDTEVKRPISPAVSDCLDYSFSLQLSDKTEVKRPVGQRSDHSRSRTLFPEFWSNIQRAGSCGWSSDDGMGQRLSAGFHNGQFHDSDCSPVSSEYIRAEVEQCIWQPADDKMSTSLPAQNRHAEEKQPVKHPPDVEVEHVIRRQSDVGMGDVLPSLGDAEVGPLSGVHPAHTPLLCHDTEEKQSIGGACGFSRCHSDTDQEDLSALFSDILAAPPLSQLSALSVENRPAPEGCENVSSPESLNDRQGDSMQDEDDSEESAVKTPVPVESVQRARSGLSEDRDRAQLHRSSPQNLPSVICQSASSSSQSELNFQQTSWPLQSRLVAEGQSSDSLDRRPEEENHLPVCEPRPTEQSFYQSDQYCLDTSHDNNERNVAGYESWNQEHAANGAAAAETVVPERSPELFQQIQNDRTITQLARTRGNMGGQPVPRQPCDINTERPWILSEGQPNPAYDSLVIFAEQVFCDGVLDGAENGRWEQQRDPPDLRISEDGYRFPQIADPVNRHVDPEEIWCRLGELQPLGHAQLEPVEDTESSSESNCLDRA